MAKRKKNRKVVLITSCVLAVLIVAGSTFAWFSSKDEVTNRLSASANYGVSIAEDFTPPENWVPGQIIDKNVGVVNTGNVDAFVRAWLEGEMRLTAKSASPSTVASTFATTLSNASTTNVTDTKLTSIGLTKQNGTTYFKTLTKTENQNANDPTQAANQTSNNTAFSEVDAIQAGGWLAYASAGFTFTTNQARNYVAVSTGTVLQKAAGATVNSTELMDTWTDGVGLAIDSDSFTPTASGLFIFRRIANYSGTNNAPEYEYSGYYADVDNGNVTYYALNTFTSNNSDYVIYSDASTNNTLTVTKDSVTGEVTSVVPTNNLKMFEATDVIKKDNDFTWSLSGSTLTATYAGADSNNNYDDIVVNITLNNIGTGTEQWTALNGTVSSKTKYTFYYNNDVEEGDTTSKLVDAVALADTTKKEAYLAFDFDLNVKMDSVQVTVDANGNETVTAAQSAFSTGAPVNITGVTDGGTAPEAGPLTWANT